MPHTPWPPLPIAAWEPTYLTLHRWTQIVGKVALALAPPMNHWWHVAMQVSSNGLTVSLPCDRRKLTIAFDFCSHRLFVHASDGRSEYLPLEAMSVADFHQRTLSLLARLDVQVRIWPVPVEVVDRTPFPLDTHHAAYDRDAVERLHQILIDVDRVFAIHRGHFLGKSSPVNFYWGAFDLAVTRFTGHPNAAPPADPVMGAAYSHEVISHGFWPGGDWPVGGRVGEPVFYAYAMPEPHGFSTAHVQPPQARYASSLNEFLLPYDIVRRSADPASTLLGFMDSTYRAAATAMAEEHRSTVDAH